MAVCVRRQIIEKQFCFFGPSATGVMRGERMGLGVRSIR